ncbi:hypothetical protein MA16_Dca022165 [Dendrobium catenatum]|uniref:Reverse transcriptase RNase H-like domain-containing protein n=1 Tax=Dendrobium catenatum TaxID=906689 RepID=A0A2I0VQQ2_9ASPA|nr:hypothetical protein MA16_Dca022165 [Dendrobium catenatum]
MCNASDIRMGDVLGLRQEINFLIIFYASKTMNFVQPNYITTKKKVLAIIYFFDKFRSYLINTKVIIYIDNTPIKYHLTKNDSKPRLVRCILLLQEFDVEVFIIKGT